MKRLIQMTSIVILLLLSGFYAFNQAAAQGGSPTEECGANTFLVKLDNIPDLEPGEEYTGSATGTDGVEYTITVRFNGPDDYTLVSSVPGLPANAILIAKFGVGGGLSHVTVCIPPVVNTPTATATNVPPTPTATDVPPTATATDVPPTATATDAPPTATATTVPGQPSPTDVPPTVTHVPDKPTDVPSHAEPTKAVTGVTALPSTGSDGGATGGGQGLIVLAAASAALMAAAGVVLTNRARDQR